MIDKGKMPGLLALIAKPKRAPGAEPDDDEEVTGTSTVELDSAIKEVARSIKEMDTSAIEDALHGLVEVLQDEDDEGDEDGG